MVAILIEGLVGITSSVRERVSKSKRFKGIYLGIDSYITAGYEDVISAVVLTMVFTEVACMLIPTIKSLPVTGLPFFIGDVNFILPYVSGNILLAAITATIWEIIGAHFATWVAPIYTQGMAMYGTVTPGTLYTWVVCPGWHIALWIWNLIWQLITHFGAMTGMAAVTTVAIASVAIVEKKKAEATKEKA
jgi:galactitol-specific phosphotransferase system IIC component